MTPTQAAAIPCLLTGDQIARRVEELARQISQDYQGREPLVVGVLKGAFVFTADLVRRLTVPVRCDFVKLSSYGLGTESTGQVTLQLDLTIDARDQDILLVEDIIDTGTTIPWLLEHLRQKQPRSIRLCALLDKPARRKTPVHIDYLGFTIPDQFVVGYGIDCGEQFRALPYVGHVISGEAGDGERT